MGSPLLDLLVCLVRFTKSVFWIQNDCRAPASDRFDPLALLYNNIDSKIDKPELESKMEAYKELKKLIVSSDPDPELLWRMAKVCHGISVLNGLKDDMKLKKFYIDEGVAYATSCLEQAPRSAEAHMWYAITIGARSEFLPVAERIKDGFTFKHHIDEALKISPNDPRLLHLLGRFRFEVAMLTWVERKMANMVFGEVPYATMPEALEVLLKVEKLSHEPWKENRIIIAKCYIQLGEYAKAVQWLDKAHEIEPQSPDERRVHMEGQALLDKYGSYRKKK